MNEDKAYLEAQRILKISCKTLGVNFFDSDQNRQAVKVAILIADEIISSNPCESRYFPDRTSKELFYIDVKYELLKI